MFKIKTHINDNLSSHVGKIQRVSRYYHYSIPDCLCNVSNVLQLLKLALAGQRPGGKYTARAAVFSSKTGATSRSSPRKNCSRPTSKPAAQPRPRDRVALNLRQKRFPNQTELKPNHISHVIRSKSNSSSRALIWTRCCSCVEPGAGRIYEHAVPEQRHARRVVLRHEGAAVGREVPEDRREAPHLWLRAARAQACDKKMPLK